MKKIMNKYSVRYGLVPTNIHGYRTATVEANSEKDARKLLYLAVGDPCGDRYWVMDVYPYKEHEKIAGKVINLG